MKKIVAIAAFLMLLQGIVIAQETDVRLGFQVSPVISFMGSTDDNQINGNGANLGLKLGAKGEIYFRENYAFIIGLGFAFNSGGTLRHELGGKIWQRSEIPEAINPQFGLPAGTDLKYSIQYVEIPFGLKFRTREFGYLRYFAEIPVITLGFKSQAKGTIQYQGINETDKYTIQKEVNSLALSWGVGGGVEYSIGSSTSLIGGLGYQRVFTDVTKDYDGDADSKNFINNVIIHLGVMF